MVARGGGAVSCERGTPVTAHLSLEQASVKCKRKDSDTSIGYHTVQACLAHKKLSLEQASVKCKRKDSAMDVQGEARIGKDFGGVPLLSLRKCLLMSFGKSTPPQHRQLCILMSNKQ